LDRRGIERIVKGSFHGFWYEAFSLSPRTKAFMPKDVKVQGLENLQKALEKGRGVILWESVFLGRRVLAKQMLQELGFPIHQVHARHHLGGFKHSGSWMCTHVIQRFLESCERPFVTDILHLDRVNSVAFTRDLLGRLKQNAIICITADGKVGQKFISIKFLGHKEWFSTGVANLAKFSGATILPLFCVQETRDRASLIIERPIRTGTGKQICLEDTYVQYANLLESYIRRYPEQYRHSRSSDVSNLPLR
jgi:lauroyl/myristoyl acyltransferase